MNDNKSFLSNKILEWARDITALGSPLILLFVPFIFFGFSKVFVFLLIALLLNEILASLIKIVFPKKRPTGQTYRNLIEKIDAGSFPSIHVARITLVYLCLFTNTDNISFKIIFLLVIGLVIFSRVLLKKHYWVDVLGGFVMGTLIWYIFHIILHLL